MPANSETFLGFFRKLLHADFMPHGHCYWWKPEIVWLHVLSDLFIGVSYFSIPLMVVYFVKKRRDVPFHWIFYLFAAFIFWCGMTHFLNIVTLWNPVYRLDGVVKAITAAVSVVTAFYLFPLIPQALALKSAAQYEEKNRALRQEIERREQAEELLRAANENLEKRVAERTRRLEASNRDLEQFAYIASHDLKEPLRIVSLYSQLLVRKYGGKLDTDAQTYLGLLTENTLRMQQLIDAVLLYSRVGRHERTRVFVPSGHALEHALGNLKLPIEKNRARIDIGALPSLWVVESELQQLFQNLVSNALKYNDKAQPHIVISTQLVEGETVFAVKDNGLGIDPQYKQKVFQIFQRLRVAEGYEGTGIGLAICKKIVELYEGRIWLSSDDGPGTTFYFTLPAAFHDGS